MNINSSPRNIAVISALLVALIPAICIWFLFHELSWVAILFIFTAVLGYFIIHYLLERFVYRKIKIIYKSINLSKTEYLHIDEEIDPISKVSTDVSKWARERREEIALLKEQEKFRREFIGNVSHELKTPIFHIQGYIHTLMEGALSDPKVNYHFLKKSADSVDRLIELVDDLTDINRIESGELEMEYSDFDLRLLVEEVYDEVDYLRKERKVTCTFKQSAQNSFMVHADRMKIKQVLVNLVVNAIKYGRDEGNIACGIYDMDQTILIEISDDGEGIPEASLPRLFERFYRVEKSRTRHEGGSGLGLSIAKHIVEAHEQTIQVRSQLGVGSTFSFSLAKAE